MTYRSALMKSNSAASLEGPAKKAARPFLSAPHGSVLRYRHTTIKLPGSLQSLTPAAPTAFKEIE